MNFITSTELDNWARTRMSQGELPDLFHRLIYETINLDDLEKIRFPSGDDIQTGGVDGYLKTSKRRGYIPEGISIWEFGQKKDIKGKADDDFQSRTSASIGYKIEDTIFVFATSHKWGNKEKWVNHQVFCNDIKISEKWKDIVAYDSRDIEKWLIEAPSTSSWLSRKIIKNYSDNIEAVDDFWDRWSCTSYGNLDCQIHLIGREKEKEQIENWFLNLSSERIDNRRLILGANSMNEAISFIAAVVLNMDKGVQDKFFSKAVIIKTEQDFLDIMKMKSSHIIFCGPENINNISKAIQSNHKVIMYTNDDISNLLSIGNIDIVKLRRELVRLNFDEKIIEEVIVKANGSIGQLKSLLI